MKLRRLNSNYEGVRFRKMTVITSPETSATILLLSSEPVVRSVMKEALEHVGYIVLATGELGGAVDWLTSADVNLLITHPYTISRDTKLPSTYGQKNLTKWRFLSSRDFWTMIGFNTVRSWRSSRYFLHHLPPLN
jgi:CheY-like chemotaxis protein